jgi:lipoate-protein ligase A
MEARLIVETPAPGDWNMAVDEVLLESAAVGEPVLRFYRWSTATLSLGYFQRVTDREPHASSRGCPLVRRATGGGAIVHDRELTYSFAARDTGMGWHQRLYDAFHETLIELLRDEGIVAESHCGATSSLVRIGGAVDDIQGRGDAEPFLCFLRRAEGDVVLQGAKICGSAQRRNRGTILQHGSVLLATSPQAPELPGIEELTGKKLDPLELAAKWQGRLAARLGLAWRERPISSVERERATSVQLEKFGAEAWTDRRV